MSERIRFNPLEDEALDDLIRQTLVAALGRLPVPSSEVWQALVARIQIEQGLLTADLGIRQQIKPHTEARRGQETDPR